MLPSESYRKEMSHTEGSNPRPAEQITVALPPELQGQMGAGRGELRW